MSFAGGIVLSDAESSDFEKELNVTDLALEEEPVIQFNHSGDAIESLVTAPVQVSKASKKPHRDVAPNEEELIEGSDLYIKPSYSWVSGYSKVDLKKHESFEFSESGS